MSGSASAFPLRQRRPLVLADLVSGTVVRNLVLVVGGAALTGLLAQLSIPVHGSPVPVTGETFGALVVGAALGWRRAFASMGLY
ncbi:MAG: biotin transporter BioY, partial [Nocardioidaceae bacterium]